MDNWVKLGPCVRRSRHHRAQHKKVYIIGHRDDRLSSLTRRSPPRDDRKVEDFYRKPSTSSTSSSTLEKRPKQTSSSRYNTLPMTIPSATFYLGPKFESLPSSLEAQKPVQLTSVLKKPGSVKSDRKSLKKVAFLESSYWYQNEPGYFSYDVKTVYPTRFKTDFCHIWTFISAVTQWPFYVKM